MSEPAIARWRGRLRPALWRLMGLGPLVARVMRLETELAAAEQRLHHQLELLEGRLLESRDALETRAKRRWASTRADESLTWGRRLGGDAFVDAVLRHVTTTPESSILEIGPGYGRILSSFLHRQPSYRRYLAIDLSPKVIAQLRDAFGDPRITFELADAEELGGGEPFDLVWSALTFKHLFPSIARVLVAVARRLAPGGLLAFDLVEGEGMHFERDGVTFLRHYSRDEVLAFLAGAGLRLVAFDSVRHDDADARSTRLLIIARRADPGAAVAEASP